MEINKGKFKGNESVLVYQIREFFSSLESYQNSSKQIPEEYFTDSEVILIQHEKIQHKKYNTHVQREVGLSSPELSIMEKGPNQKSVEIQPIPFKNDDPINYKIENTGKI